MTTTLVRPAVAVPAVSLPVALRWERKRLLSRRAAVGAALTAVAMIGTGGLEGLRWSQLLVGPRPDFDAAGTVLHGVRVAQLVVAVSAVLAGAAPRPRTVPVRTAFVAKVVVVAGSTLVLTEVSSLVAFLLGQHELGAYAVSLARQDSLRAVAGAGLHLTAVCLLGLGIGTVAGLLRQRPYGAGDEHGQREQHAHCGHCVQHGELLAEEADQWRAAEERAVADRRDDADPRRRV